MIYESGFDSVEINAVESEIVSGISSYVNRTAASPVVSTVSSSRDSATISNEALLMAAAIVPSIEEQEYDDRFHRLIAIQGGLVGPGGVMINITTIEDPVYVIIKDESITVSGTDISSYQNAHKIRQETLRMLEYIRLLTQGIKIEEGQILQEKLRIMVDNLATVQGEMAGDPNYSKDDKPLEEAFRSITTILIADATRVEYSDMPDNDRMIFEARSMADLFNDLFFESLTNHGVKESFERAMSALD